MTNINPKLTALITTIATFALPAAGASASGNWRSLPAHHYATVRSERHFATSHARRPTTKFQRETRSWS